MRRSSAIEVLAKKVPEINPKTKNSKSIRTKFKRLAKISDGKQQLKKFISRRRTFNDMEENVEDQSLPTIQQPLNLEVSEVPSIAQIQEQQDKEQTCAQNQSLLITQVLQDGDNEENSHAANQKSPVQADAHNSEINRQSPAVSYSSSNNTSPNHSSLMLNNMNNREAEYIETPRSVRRRRRPINLITYRRKINANDNEEAVYNNYLEAETREIDAEGKELYAKEGNEIYVGCNKMIQLAFWEYMKHRGPWVFLRELLVIYWGEHDLVNRCFRVSKIRTDIENRSPKKLFTPSKYRTLRRVFKDYLNENMGNSSKKKKVLKNMNRHIGYKVRDLRKSLYEKVN